MKVTVSIDITEKIGSFDTNTIAQAKLEVEAPWDDIKPTSIAQVVSGAVSDVQERLTDQLVRIEKAEIAKRREAEREALATEVL